jgi:hypothetical protein
VLQKRKIILHKIRLLSVCYILTNVLLSFLSILWNTGSCQQSCDSRGVHFCVHDHSSSLSASITPTPQNILQFYLLHCFLRLFNCVSNYCLTLFFLHLIIDILLHFISPLFHRSDADKTIVIYKKYYYIIRSTLCKHEIIHCLKPNLYCIR